MSSWSTFAAHVERQESLWAQGLAHTPEVLRGRAEDWLATARKDTPPTDAETLGGLLALFGPRAHWKDETRYLGALLPR